MTPFKMAANSSPHQPFRPWSRPFGQTIIPFYMAAMPFQSIHLNRPTNRSTPRCHPRHSRRPSRRMPLFHRPTSRKSSPPPSCRHRRHLHRPSSSSTSRLHPWPPQPRRLSRASHLRTCHPQVWVHALGWLLLHHRTPHHRVMTPFKVVANSSLHQRTIRMAAMPFQSIQHPVLPQPAERSLQPPTMFLLAAMPFQSIQHRHLLHHRTPHHRSVSTTILFRMAAMPFQSIQHRTPGRSVGSFPLFLLAAMPFQSIQHRQRCRHISQLHLNRRHVSRPPSRKSSPPLSCRSTSRFHPWPPQPRRLSRGSHLLLNRNRRHCHRPAPCNTSSHHPPSPPPCRYHRRRRHFRHCRRLQRRQVQL